MPASGSEREPEAVGAESAAEPAVYYVAASWRGLRRREDHSAMGGTTAESEVVGAD